MQVIRRGDRRPFYAPARYVVELRPEEIELASATAEVASTQRVLHGLGGGGMPFHQRHHPGGHAVQHRSHHGGNRGGRMGGRMPDSGGFCLPDSDVGGGGPHPRTPVGGVGDVNAAAGSGNADIGQAPFFLQAIHAAFIECALMWEQSFLPSRQEHDIEFQTFRAV